MSESWNDTLLVAHINVKPERHEYFTFNEISYLLFHTKTAGFSFVENVEELIKLLFVDHILLCLFFERRMLSLILKSG